MTLMVLPTLVCIHPILCHGLGEATVRSRGYPYSLLNGERSGASKDVPFPHDINFNSFWDDDLH
jgi:hypothetical protein